MASVLGEGKVLTDLSSAEKSIGDEGAGRQAETLGECVRRLDAGEAAGESDNRIGEQGVGRLAGVLVECKALSYLDLSQNSVDAGQESMLAGALGRCTEAVKRWESR
eukprot:2579157-Rhodomonas_salina.2